MFPVKYELGFSIPRGGILHGHRRENPNLTKYNPVVETLKQSGYKSKD
jgi:hypothetical protein